MDSYPEFERLEREGWGEEARARRYVELFSPGSDQTVDALIAGAAVEAGQEALDLCCGHGNVSQALLDAGARATGLDFSPAFLALAAERAPGARLVEGDAQAMPFVDAGFDAVLCNFGLMHVPDQPAALSEVRRVLRPGGRFAFCVWCGPDRSPGFATVYGAVREAGHPDTALPDAPDFHRFADPAQAQELLSEAGFVSVASREVPVVWRLARPNDLFTMFREATVRAAMLIDAQPDEAHREAIREAMTALALQAGRLVPAGFEIDFPAALVTASVPAA